MSKSICMCDILFVSEDGSVSGAWALLRCREARTQTGGPSGSRAHSNLGVRFQPGEGGGSAHLGVGRKGERLTFGVKGKQWVGSWVMDRI